MEDTPTFKVGRTYRTRSICNYDCIVELTVMKRTPHFVTLKRTNLNYDCDELIRRKVSTSRYGEGCSYGAGFWLSADCDVELRPNC